MNKNFTPVTTILFFIAMTQLLAQKTNKYYEYDQYLDKFEAHDFLM
jgi:hypothetical protein